MSDGEVGEERERLEHEGSLFWFTVKLRHPLAAISLRHRPTDNLAKIKVLVVDDNATNGRMVHYQLAALNMPDEYASSAEKALRKLRTAAAAGSPYPLAILDMQMPDMDGLALARVMQSDPQSDPTLSRTRKIMLTSLGLSLESRVMHDAGISECLVKPAKEARVFECLIRVMGEASTPFEARNPPGVVGISLPFQNPIHGPLRILLAEDTPVNQRVVLAQLRKLGYEADIAVNRLEVLSASEQTHYDVILMEIATCPKWEVARQHGRFVSVNRPATVIQHRARIVALAAHAMEGDREKCLAAGMDDYLSKPTRIDDLYAALARFREELSSNADKMPGHPGET